MPIMNKNNIVKLTLISSALATLVAPSVSYGAIPEKMNIYGYLSWRMEKVWDEVQVDGSTADAPREITVPSFNIMIQHQVSDKVKVFANLNGENGEDVSVRNIWGEYKINNMLNIRLGKTYRRFGIYNEQLDAVPTYIGIEPPELFDKDHLILSRETLAMAHGWIPLGDGELNYSLSVDNGEGGPSDEDNIPLGFDINYDFNFGAYKIGVSGYTSGGDTVSDVGIGEGSPRTGVLPWMAADDFSILGAYGQFQFSQFTIQTEYWNASHSATRDPLGMSTVLQNATINPQQISRFLLNGDSDFSVANIDTNGDYDITTWYVRAGYSIDTKYGEFVPYLQWDYYENPETIFDKQYGGDAEAGLADDGKFTKSTVGFIFRPEPYIAIKLDTSTHFQTVGGEDTDYSEIRLDVSYIFGQ